MPRKITLADAKAQYPHRYTMEHVPAWALKQRDDGKYFAPQYRSDAEWYENTIFPGEPGVHGNRKFCESNNCTWPLGMSLDEPFSPS